MDERVMLMWVRTILKPFIEHCPIDIQPLLLLDSFKCHTMARATGELNKALGIQQVNIIPGGCTGMCHPIDVAIGKPLKTRARHLWEEWMVTECADGRGASHSASQLQMSQWIADSAVQLIHSSESMVRNTLTFQMKKHLLPAAVKKTLPRSLVVKVTMLLRRSLEMKTLRCQVMMVVVTRRQQALQVLCLEHFLLHLLQHFLIVKVHIVPTLVGITHWTPSTNKKRIHLTPADVFKTCISTSVCCRD